LGDDGYIRMIFVEANQDQAFPKDECALGKITRGGAVGENPKSAPAEDAS
jgi:hypothetical protein